MYFEIVDGSCAGFEPSPEKLRIRDGTMALASGPAVDSAAEITAEDAGSAIDSVTPSKTIKVSVTTIGS